MAAQSAPQLKYVALGITNMCSHHCNFCYETANLKATDRKHGDFNILRNICHELVKANVDFVELVGGDPAEHPDIGRLTEYLSDHGINVGILSNTHKSWKAVAPHVSNLEWTVHGPESYHDAYTKLGAYQRTLKRLKKFASVKNGTQQIGLTINFTKIMVCELYNVIQNLSQEIPINYVQLQRIGPFGGAANRYYKLELSEIVAIYHQIQKIDRELNIGIEVVDSYPLCILPEELRKYTARCDWGYGTGYIDMSGNLSRCAVNQIPLGNILNPKTPLAELWSRHPALIKFRKKQYLPPKCQFCDLLKQCGGGCPSSCGGHNLSADQLAIS